MGFYSVVSLYLLFILILHQQAMWLLWTYLKKDLCVSVIASNIYLYL